MYKIKGERNNSFFYFLKKTWKKRKIVYNRNIEKSEENMKSLEENIGYTFKDKELLKKALTHTSYA